ncbi:MAG: DUF2975 domain-containing protein [Bacteroidia bacterium]|jgi:hypothetical protein|nr:DUF2975 domain-containing protein [Bacteroidia bacterium]
MKTIQRDFIPFLYWIFKIWFWVQLVITLGLVSVNYVDWFGSLHDEPLRFTIRGNFALIPNPNKPDTTFQLIRDEGGAEVISLIHRNGWARIDYADLSQMLESENVLIVSLEVIAWFGWLMCVYSIYRILRQCKYGDVFHRNTVRFIRWGAGSYFAADFLSYIKSQIFTNVLQYHIKYDDFYISDVKKDTIALVVCSLLLALIAEVINYGITLKEEQDLTI